MRDAILAMEGYVPGEQPPDGSYIKLNTNENPYPPSPAVAEAVAAEAARAHLYPDPLSTPLRKAAAALYGVSLEQVIAGNGSDDILNLLVRATAEEGAVVASFQPSYTLYRTLAEIQGARFRALPFTDGYGLPEAMDLSEVRILFLPNPNAPSGTLVGPDEIRRLCDRCPGIVVIDEAYADFAGVTALPLLAECGRLVVCRTFSKSYSLAGLRIGLGFAAPEIVRELMKVKESYNLDRLAIAAGAAALGDQETFRRNVTRVVATRERLSAALQKLGVAVYPSHANFVLARFTRPSAREIYAALKKRRILVRYFDAPRLDDCLRITVGTEAETDAFLAALAEILRA